MSKALQVNTTGVINSTSTTAHYLQQSLPPTNTGTPIQCGGVRILPYEGSIHDHTAR
jgi:hypothetical protein